jgi:NAD(P)-dependent dehydrogenase (short-subunit alcohol dehydrogenase family)
MLITQYFAKDLYRGKTVFVTGGGSSINLGVAKNFAALGARIAICGRTQEKLDAAAEELCALGANVCPWPPTCATSPPWTQPSLAAAASSDPWTC